MTVTFSRLVGSCAKANFYHPYGLKAGDDLLDHVGIPRLQHFSDRSWLDDRSLAPQAQALTIVVMHYDPGFDKYLSQPVELRAVLDLAWYMTLYVADRLIRRIRHAEERGRSIDRRELIDSVYLECSRNEGDIASKNPALMDLYRRLDEAKAALRRWYTRGRELRKYRLPTVYTEEMRRIRADGAVERYRQSPHAEGLLRSAERQQQIRRLYKLRMADMFIHIPWEERDRWMEWALSRPKGTSFAASALASAPKPDPVANALQMFAPEGATDRSWMDDPNQLQRVLAAKGAHLKTFLPPDFFSSEKQSERVRRRFATNPLYQFTRILNGREVIIQANGDMILRWKAPAALVKGAAEDQDITLKIRLPKSAVPLKEGDKRSVQFLAHGIGVIDENQRPLSRPGYSASEGLMRSADFILHQESQLLQALWNSERRVVAPSRRLIQQTLADTLGGRTRRASETEAGRKLFKQQSSEKTLAAFRPIRRNDSIWLLQQWLSATYPQGGTFAIVDAVEFPDENSMVPSFTAFLNQHLDHPWVR